MTVTKTRIFSQAAVALGEIPISAISQQETAAQTIFEAAWDQFIPQFIEETQLKDFMLEQETTSVDVGSLVTVDEGAAVLTISEVILPEDRDAAHLISAHEGETILKPLEVEFDQDRLGSEAADWSYGGVAVTGTLTPPGTAGTKRIIRLLTTRGGGTTPNVRYLYQPAEPASADDEYGHGISYATERAIALSFAEFLAPARANDAQTMAQIQADALQARRKARALSGRLGTRRMKQESSVLAARRLGWRSGYGRY